MVEKNNIKRTDLKSDFLKQMIIRIDYDYLFKEDIESIVKNCYDYLIDNDYKMNSKTLAEFNINVDIENLTSEDNGGINMKDNNKEVFSSFVKKENNIVIDITKNFTTMTVNYNNFVRFNQLIEDFSKITGEIKKVRKGIEIKRVGIRKFNFYILKDISKINEYFEQNLFDFNKMVEDKNDFIVKQTIESFKFENYKVNELGNITKGILTNENKEKSKVYQVVLDIDVYDDEIENNDIHLEKMNEVLFNVYKSALNINFLEKLKKENYEDEVIMKI